MPLGEFMAEVMEILDQDPAANEILNKKVLPLCLSDQDDSHSYQNFFRQLNIAR